MFKRTYPYIILLIKGSSNINNYIGIWKSAWKHHSSFNGLFAPGDIQISLSLLSASDYKSFPRLFNASWLSDLRTKEPCVIHLSTQRAAALTSFGPEDDFSRSDPWIVLFFKLPVNLQMRNIPLPFKSKLTSRWLMPQSCEWFPPSTLNMSAVASECLEGKQTLAHWILHNNSIFLCTLESE